MAHAVERLGDGVAIALLQRSVSSVAFPPSCFMKLRATLSSAVHEETDHQVITCVRLGEGVRAVCRVCVVCVVCVVCGVCGVCGLQPYPAGCSPTRGPCAR